MPAPVSRTVTPSILSDAFATQTSTRPPAGVNLIALSIRLTNTCSTRPQSTSTGGSSGAASAARVRPASSARLDSTPTVCRTSAARSDGCRFKVSLPV
jgi:hypothetical protein